MVSRVAQIVLVKASAKSDSHNQILVSDAENAFAAEKPARVSIGKYL